MPNSLPNRKRLTDLTVARMGPGICWDTLLPAFGVRVGARRRTWIVAINASKRKVGTFPEMGLSEARDRAREMMAGKAPAAPATFSELVAQFLEHGRTRKGRELRQNSIVQYRRVLNGYAKPLHPRPFAEITRRDVADLLRRIANESGAPTASLVRSMLARLWAYAIETGEVEVNVVQNTPGYEVSKRSRVLTDAELAALWQATENGEAYSLIVRLLLWTGARRSEAGGLRWSELIDGDWRIPSERTKNHRPLVLPLPHQARDAIAHWQRIVGRDTLFGVWSARGFTSWSEAKAALDARLGFDRDWDLHDIRRSVQTRMIGLGVPREHVNRVLNHAMGPIDEAYDLHPYTAEKRAALQRWADELERIVDTGAGKVLEIRR